MLHKQLREREREQSKLLIPLDIYFFVLLYSLRAEQRRRKIINPSSLTGWRSVHTQELIGISNISRTRSPLQRTYKDPFFDKQGLEMPKALSSLLYSACCWFHFLHRQEDEKKRKNKESTWLEAQQGLIPAGSDYTQNQSKKTARRSIIRPNSHSLLSDTYNEGVSENIM